MNVPEAIEPEGAVARIAAYGPSRYFNRELSWLNFNKRVMEEAENERHPLLERLRFLSISANNLDEFYMVRVAGLRAQMVAGIETPSQDGLTPAQQLDRINRSVADLTALQQETWVALEALLGEAGIHVLTADQLTEAERSWLEDHFLNLIFPVADPDRRRSGSSVPVHSEFRIHAGAGTGARRIVPHDARASADPVPARPLYPAAGRQGRCDGDSLRAA